MAGEVGPAPLTVWSVDGVRALIRNTLRDSSDDRIVGLGAEVAFFALLSFPPTLLALFGSVGFVARWLGPDATTNIREQVLDAASPFLTADGLTSLGNTVDGFLEQGRAGIALAGLAVALWSASRATKVFMEAVGLAYDLPERRTTIRRRLVALGITALGILAAAIVLPLVVAGPRLGHWVGDAIGLGDALATAWSYLYWPGVGVLGVAMLTTFYHFAPSWTTPWRRDVPGAVLAAVLWLAGGVGLRIYASLTLEGSALYGSLAAPIVILLWLWLTAWAALLGAELNAEYEKLWPTTGYTEALAKVHGTR